MKKKNNKLLAVKKNNFFLKIINKLKTFFQKNINVFDGKIKNKTNHIENESIQTKSKENLRKKLEMLEKEYQTLNIKYSKKEKELQKIRKKELTLTLQIYTFEEIYLKNILSIKKSQLEKL